MNESLLREELAKAIGWKAAHATLEDATAGVSPSDRGVRAPGFPHTLWELLEHIRIAQADLLDFCRNPSYAELKWPNEYWPDELAPPSDAAWEESLRRIQADRESLQELTLDPQFDLTGRIPHGSGQTYLRELFLAIDHTAYHVGQMVAVRRLLGSWEDGR
ncbi:MAG: DinB family protein [Gemmatimonadota bacterium]